MHWKNALATEMIENHKSVEIKKKQTKERGNANIWYNSYYTAKWKKILHEIKMNSQNSDGILNKNITDTTF